MGKEKLTNKILNKETAEGKGLRTAYQAVVGTVITFFTGLWAIPEVQEYTSNFIQTEGIGLVVIILGAVGVTSGVISWLQNAGIFTRATNWLKNKLGLGK